LQARPYYPGVYTRVTRYLGIIMLLCLFVLQNKNKNETNIFLFADWIHEHSKDGCFCNQ
jgi:hypothetical protein